MPRAMGGPLDFQPLSLNGDDRVMVSEGYEAQVLLRWGDPVLKGSPEFRVDAQTRASQEMQFGYNCDYAAYLPLMTLPGDERGLLFVNHEYTLGDLMFPGYISGTPTKNQVEVEIAAHGASVVEIRRTGDGWKPVMDSPYNRRITGYTAMDISGPAKGHPLLRTAEDPTGTKVTGMFNNCGGGKTPWGTVLTAEENFNQYFGNAGDLAADDADRLRHATYGLPEGSSGRRWEEHDPRFDVSNEPKSPYRYGYLVEIDPRKPEQAPVKRTALGRFKHEAAAIGTAASSRRVVVYSGDDQRFEYVYKFVSDGQLTPGADGGTLLDSGTLYVARFNSDGSGDWLPLTPEGLPLRENGSRWTAAEIAIHTRDAADLLDGTPMDRPEDIEINPVNQRVYVAMTKNKKRGLTGNAGPDAANPRAENKSGHIIEMEEAGGELDALTFSWNVFMLCGRPEEADTYFAGFSKAAVSPIANPDNLLFDRDGNLWITTDGQISTFKQNDGIYAVPTTGPERGWVRQFLSGVPDGEVTGPELTPAETSMFVSIQHPGEDSDPANPTSRFPDYDPAMPPRPSVMVVTGNNGEIIGRS